MNDMIERYIYDVTRRLPENEHGEVGRELRANIHDMLPENAGARDIREVLVSLGPPAALAEKYRQKPRYLISPAFFDSYITTLKHVVPLVGVIVMVVGLVLGGIDSIREGASEAWEFVAAVLTRGISVGAEAAIQALLWTTVGFVIAERAGARIGEDWTPESLPEVPKRGKHIIPLSQSIAELASTLVLYALWIFMLVKGLPVSYVTQDGYTIALHWFSPECRSALVPFLFAACALAVFRGAVKIKERRWTPLVCAACASHNLVTIGAALYFVFMPRVFSAEFIAYGRTQDTGNYLIRFFGNGEGTSVIAVIFAAIVLIGGGARIISEVYKTVRSMNG